MSSPPPGAAPAPTSPPSPAAPETPPYTPSPEIPPYTPSPETSPYTPPYTPPPETPPYTPSPETSPYTPPYTPPPETPPYTPSPETSPYTPSPETSPYTPPPPPLPSPAPPPENGTPPAVGSNKNTPSVALVVAIGIAGASVLVCVGIFVIWYKRRNRRRLRREGPPYPQGPNEDSFRGPQQNLQQHAPPSSGSIFGLPRPMPPPGMSSNPESSSMDGSTPLPPVYDNNQDYSKPIPQAASDTILAITKTTFTYEDLVRATDNFSGANLLGQGGFGYVHKGVLSNGKEVAIKQLKVGSGQGEREFQAEVETISRVHHRHLVSLVGHCISGTQRLLVYEYVSNGTLEFHLHGMPSWDLT